MGIIYIIYKTMTKCERAFCDFAKHSSQGHNFCCHRCKGGGGHGPACQQVKYVAIINDLSQCLDKIYHIKNIGSGLVLDICDASKSDSAVSQIWSQHGGTNQQFKINRDGTICVVHSGKALDVCGGAKSQAKIIQ